MYETQYIYGARLTKPDNARVLHIKEFLLRHSLTPDEDADFTVVLMNSTGGIAATGSITRNVLKFIAVDENEQGTGACANVVSELVNYAYREGIYSLFLFTKPENETLFRSLGFYTLAKTRFALMMENSKNGLSDYINGLEKPKAEGITGAIAANCNPMTLGHLYLMEKASCLCDYLHVFILSEDRSEFSTDTRYEIVEEAVRHIKNLYLHKTSHYMVSSATFPTYFIKEKARACQINADLDLVLFGSKIAPALNITKRFVGTEPFCEVTNAYNQRMKEILPQYGIEVMELERTGGISASYVRKLIHEGRFEEVREIVPDAAYKRIINNKNNR